MMDLTVMTTSTSTTISWTLHRLKVLACEAATDILNGLDTLALR